MLNNWTYGTKIRNFIKSGFYVDHFFKKIVITCLYNTVQFIIFFLEKYTVDYVVRTLYLAVNSLSYVQNVYTVKLVNFTVVTLNMMITLFILFI